MEGGLIGCGGWFDRVWRVVLLGVDVVWLLLSGLWYSLKIERYIQILDYFNIAFDDFFQSMVMEYSSPGE